MSETENSVELWRCASREILIDFLSMINPGICLQHYNILTLRRMAELASNDFENWYRTRNRAKTPILSYLAEIAMEYHRQGAGGDSGKDLESSRNPDWGLLIDRIAQIGIDPSKERLTLLTIAALSLRAVQSYDHDHPK